MGCFSHKLYWIVKKVVFSVLKQCEWNCLFMASVCIGDCQNRGGITLLTKTPQIIPGKLPFHKYFVFKSLVTS